MSTHKHIDKICCAILAAALLLTALLLYGSKLVGKAAKISMGYDAKLFDTSTVHSIDITMDDWDSFLDTCKNEEYTSCTVTIDNEAYKNVAIRAKGNTSLTQVDSYGNNRYSFKIEFDHYDNSQTYFGLDKLCLNNMIQDNTYMKDYLAYQMMGAFGVPAPLCSYTYITVNGEDWGLYLAVEGMEESFLQRNYGRDYGSLYKPDSQSIGGGRGNGRKFDMNDMPEGNNAPDRGKMPEAGNKPDREPSPEDMLPGNMPQDDMLQNGISQDDIPQDGIPQDGMRPDGAFDGKGGMNMGSNDVLLIYTDDAYESYSNIFDTAKTTITDSDKDRLIASLKSLNTNENIEDVVEIDSVIRYFVVHNFLLNFDSYTGSMIHNYYLYEKDGKLSMIPWDYNLAFGGFEPAADATSLVNYPIDSPISGSSIDSRPMLAWIFENETCTELYHQYFNEFISEYFDSGYFAEMTDAVTKMIAPYVEKDPTRFCTYKEFERGTTTLKEFSLLRAESIKGQLNGAIASTSEAQKLNSDGFIDADGLSISDMGSMKNSMGRGGKGDAGNDRDNMPDMPDMSDMPDMPGMPDMSDMPVMPVMPDIPHMAQQPSADKSATWILLGVSAAVLLSGLLFAGFYRRRRKLNPVSSARYLRHTDK